VWRTGVLRRDYLIGLLIPMNPNQGVIPIMLVAGVKVEVEGEGEVEAFFVT